MCDDHGPSAAESAWSAPRAAAGLAVDPVTGHCTGWRAQHALAAALPGAWVQTSVGTTYTLPAA